MIFLFPTILKFTNFKFQTLNIMRKYETFIFFVTLQYFSNLHLKYRMLEDDMLSQTYHYIDWLFFYPSTIFQQTISFLIAYVVLSVFDSSIFLIQFQGFYIILSNFLSYLRPSYEMRYDRRIFIFTSDCNLFKFLYMVILTHRQSILEMIRSLVIQFSCISYLSVVYVTKLDLRKNILDSENFDGEKS